MIMWLKEKRERADRGAGRERYFWSREGGERLKENIRGMKRSEGGIEEKKEEMKRKIKVALGEVKRNSKEGRRKGWWDKECREEKKKVRKDLSDWKRGRRHGGRYRCAKSKYKEKCRQKKTESNEKWMQWIKEIRTKGQVWEVVNAERRRSARINNGILMYKWEGYFKELLQGVSWKVVRGMRARNREDEEEELTREVVAEKIEGGKGDRDR